MDNTAVPMNLAEILPSTSRPSSMSATTVSPAVLMFPRGHSSRSSASSPSLATSPIPPRDSFDLYGSIKRLEDVREEPQERDEEWTTGDEITGFYGMLTPRQEEEQLMTSEVVEQSSSSRRQSFEPASPSLHPEYSLGDHDSWSRTSSGQHQFKRQRSTDHRHSITDRVSSRFGSISRRWKSRSGAGPQLSIITHGVTPQRSASATSSMVSPALSAISKHESYLPASPCASGMDEMLHESAVVPLFIDSRTETEEEHEHIPVTTPLLPPMVAELSNKRNSPLQSPLQSPSIAATPCIGSSRISVDCAAASLPSPPLSTRPSMASMQRSRENTLTTLTNDIPPLQLHDDRHDHWDACLGHANFSIHPEPYVPEHIHLDAYKEFRANWDLARKQYAQHLARTTEHYGETSKIYRLTQKKWDTIDEAWKRQDTTMTETLSPILARLHGEVAESPVSPNVLEKPLTRVVIPMFDKSGKFPEIGDADIVGPLTIGPPKVAEMQRRSLHTPPDSPKKRNLFKYFSDVLGRHNNMR